FFGPHADSSTESDAPSVATGRRVSIVVFLNGESTDDDNCYSGGSLTFFGLMHDPRANDRGFPITGETGLLVAFPSHCVHSVTPVTRGTRFTIVSWLEGTAGCQK